MNAIHQLLTQHLELTQHLDIWVGSEPEKKSNHGRNAGGAGTLYGIKKLRQLLLELAMRGKLVPQKQEEGTATELLHEIEIERAELAKGRSTKPENIDNEHAPYALPSNWRWVRFGDIAQHNSGKTLDKGRNTGSLRPYITTSNLYWGRFELDDVRQMPIREDELEKCTARKNDLLICEGGEAGRAAVWPYDRDICFQNHIHRARFYARINPYFAFRFFEWLNATGEVNNYRKGVGISSMSSKSLASIPFPLPPREEQRRIVAKVDELMALCDQLEARHIDAAEAHEKLVSHLLGTLTDSQNAEDFATRWQRIAVHFDTLLTTESSIEALKQTLLQLAVMGKLVPQNKEDEPSIELLKRIQAEKIHRAANGKAKNAKPQPPISEAEKPFFIPPGWEWARLGDVFDIAGGITLGRKVSGDERLELPYLRVANVQRGHLVLDSIKTIEINASELPRYRLMHDDLLVTEGGDWDKVGRTAIWKSQIDPCLHQNHIFRMRAITKGISSSWTEMYMNSIGKAYFQAASKQTTNLASINMTQLKACVLAVPPTREQHRIVAKVGELIKVCDMLKSRIVEANGLQQKLADALVEQAVLESSARKFRSASVKAEAKPVKGRATFDSQAA
jgi:type I restriction enzyme S subunit